MNGRDKGTNFENAVCRPLSQWLGQKWKPKEGFDTCPISRLPFRRRSTALVPIVGHWSGAGDILCRSDIFFPLCVEVKKWEKWSFDFMWKKGQPDPWEWWAQAEDQAAKVEKHALLIFSRNRSFIYGMMGLETHVCLQVKPDAGPIVQVRRNTVPTETVVICRLDDLIRVPPKMLERLR